MHKIKYWPIDALVRDKPVNVQYLSLILRLADILDLDPERTPKNLFYYINPKDEISIKEWKKHLSITGFRITPEEIKIEAECTNPDHERALREFIKTVDREREESHYLILSYRDDFARKYRLNLSEPINIRVHSKGYEYSEFRFELDYRKVLDLLMGEGLYGHPIVALRELLQNSVDAVRYREALEKREGNDYTPHIEVSVKNGELIIEDNGIGMDERIFENYFMKIGKSYYQSSEFREKNIDVDPVSEFGIGILSVFMVAHKFTVESRRKAFEEEFNPSKPIYFEIPTAYDYFIKKQSGRSKYGTKITMCLKSDHPFSAETFMEEISEIAPFIEYPIVVNTVKGKRVYEPLLPGEISGDFSYTKEYFDIRFDDMDKSEGIEGMLKVAKPFTSRQLVAQRGFSIIYSGWGGFNHIWASINISGQAKLTLSPNRSFVIKDEKYYNLNNKLQYKIFSEFEKHLKYYKDSNTFLQYTKYVNELLEEVIQSLQKYDVSKESIYIENELNKSMKRIFLNYVPLLTLLESGERAYQIMKELDKLPIVALTASIDWPDKISETKIIAETRELIDPKAVIILDEQKGHFRRLDFLHYILGELSEIYITSIPGVVISTFSNKKKKSRSFTVDGYIFVPKINNATGSNKPLFVHSMDDNLPDDVIFNSSHWLMSRFFYCQQPKDELSLKAIKALINQIDNALTTVWDIIFSDYYQRKNEMGRSYNVNHKLIGVIKYYPEIFEEFSEAAKKFWKDAQSFGAIPLEDEFPGFTSDDLPWFWSHEIK